MSFNSLLKWSISRSVMRWMIGSVRPNMSASCRDRKSTRLNSSHRCSSYAVFCLNKENIVTKAAQRELLGPGLIGIAAPVLVGFGLGAGALGAYLAGASLTARLLAGFMANPGRAW